MEIFKLPKDIGKLEFFSSAIILLGCTIAALISESIVTLIGRSKYSKSAEIFNILLLFLIFQALSTPIKLIMYAVDKEKLFSVIVIPLPVLKIIFNYFGFGFFGIYGMAYSTVMVYFIYLIMMLLINKDILKSILRKEIN